MEDYYSILGLDPGASQESIKLAYRRLAREHHPDRKIGSTESEKEVFSLHMAQLNGAYAILSDAKLRREYDEKLKILTSLHSSNTASPTVTTSSSAPSPRARQRTAPRDEVDLTLARELSKQLRSNLMARAKGISWEEKALEGFDWGLEGSSWSSHYCAGGRGFGILDPSAAKKFINYSEVIIVRYNRPIRKSHFLFFLPFQQISDWDAVSGEFNRFFSTGSHSKVSHIPVGIVLLDARQNRVMRFGNQLRDKGLEELLTCASTPS